MSNPIHLNVTIHNLHIQLPEALAVPHTVPIPPTYPKKAQKAEKAEKAEEKTKEEKYGGDTEYVAASPRYSWDHVIHPHAYDSIGELLWPIVMRSYGLEVVATQPLSLYSAFRESAFVRYSGNFPHRTIRDLMEYYIENTIYVFKGRMRGEEKDTFERRKMLRRMILGKGFYWLPEYFEVYLSWSRTLPLQPTLNRYQKMVRFLETLGSIGFWNLSPLDSWA